MAQRSLRRSLAALATPIIAIALLAVWTSVASAHEVTDIRATCETVTVYFTGFPPAGVTVRIAATVEGHGTQTENAFVDNTTTEAQLNISSATNALFGATANVNVDVTWTFQGPQRAHKTLSVTCGTATTTTTTPNRTTTTMIGVGGATTTTTSGRVVVSGQTTTSRAGAGSGAQTSTTAGSSAVPGASVGASPTPTRSRAGGSSLPFTGSATFPLIVAALSALGAGTGLLVTQRRRREQT